MLELDARLTGDVLRLANSAWSQPSRPILTVRDAVMRIGAAVILKLAVGSRTAAELGRPSEGYELAEGELWRHSVAAALAAEKMQSYADGEDPRRGLHRGPAARHRQGAAEPPPRRRRPAATCGPWWTMGA